MPQPSFNRITLLGRLKDAPRLHYQADNHPECMATLISVEEVSAGKVEILEIQVVFRDDLAEDFHRSLRKGQTLLIEGRLVLKKMRDIAGRNHNAFQIKGNRFVVFDDRGDGQERWTEASSSVGSVEPLGGILGKPFQSPDLSSNKE